MAVDATGAILDSASPAEGGNESTPKPMEQPIVSEDEKTQGGEDKSVPFHENPRFKELVSEKNAAKEERDALKQQLAELQGQQSPTPPSENSDMSPEGEKFLQMAEDRVMSKLQNLAAEQQKQTEEQQKQADSIVTDLKSEMGDRFDNFIEFAQGTRKTFPSASIDELKTAWQQADTGEANKVTRPSTGDRPTTKVQRIDPREDMITAARRFQDGS